MPDLSATHRCSKTTGASMLRVELGAGARPAEGFVAVDVNPAMGPHVVADALNLPFAAGSVDELRCVDVLEHLSYMVVRDALREWARVLAPGGLMYVQVPDAETIMRWFVNEPSRLRSWVSGGQTRACTALHGAQWRLLGGHADGRYVEDGGDFRNNAHYSLWAPESLQDALLATGFGVRSMITNGHPNICTNATRL